MPIDDVVVEIDKEIARLNAARKLLTGKEIKAIKRRTVSAATRRKIAKTQRERWKKNK